MKRDLDHADLCMKNAKVFNSYFRHFDEADVYIKDGKFLYIDKKKEDWLKANKEENLPWTSLWDDQGVAQGMGVRAIPSVWLVDKNGRIAFAGKYGDSIGAELRKVFGK